MNWKRLVVIFAVLLVCVSLYFSTRKPAYNEDAGDAHIMVSKSESDNAPIAPSLLDVTIPVLSTAEKSHSEEKSLPAPQFQEAAAERASVKLSRLHEDNFPEKGNTGRALDSGKPLEAITTTEDISPQVLREKLGLNQTTRKPIEENKAPEYKEGVVLVGFKDVYNDTTIKEFESLYNLSVGRKFTSIKAAEFHIKSGHSVDEIITMVSANPIVSYAEPDYTMKAFVEPDYVKQWGFNNTGQLVNGLTGTAGFDINFEAALAIYNPSQYIAVAVADSGVAFDHPEFLRTTPDADIAITWNAAELWGVAGVDDDGNGYIDDDLGWDFFDDDELPLDEFGHGTNVAGLISAFGDNSIGGTGICDEAFVLPLRIMDDFGVVWSTADMLESMSYAANRGVRIYNASYGGYTYTQSMRDQIEWLKTQDILFIAAAGNDAVDNDATPAYPASYDNTNIISVASINQKGDMSFFSNRGFTTVDIGAPGSNIFTPDVDRYNYYYEDFNPIPGGWTIGAYAGNASTWNWGVWTNNGYSWLADSGGFDIFSNLEEYDNTSNIFVTSPLINLVGAVGPQLRISYYHSIEEYYDWAIAQISKDNGVTWEDVGYGTGISDPNDLVEESMDLSPYEGESIYVRFVMESDSTNTDYGGYINEFIINEVDVFSYDGTEYIHTQGTSFSAPMVSGVAAMVWAHRPDLTFAQVRDCILNSARTIASMTGNVATNGIVDAEAALIQANTYPRVFDTWIAGYGLSVDILPGDDADGDGFSNLYEYAMNLDPSDPGNDVSTALPTVSYSNGRLWMDYTKHRKDVFYEVEASTDLVTWSDADVYMDYFGGSASRASVDMPSGGRIFMRLVMSYGIN